MSRRLAYGAQVSRSPGFPGFAPTPLRHRAATCPAKWEYAPMFRYSFSPKGLQRPVKQIDDCGVVSVERGRGAKHITSKHRDEVDSDTSSAQHIPRANSLGTHTTDCSICELRQFKAGFEQTS